MKWSFIHILFWDTSLFWGSGYQAIWEMQISKSCWRTRVCHGLYQCYCILTLWTHFRHSFFCYLPTNNDQYFRKELWNEKVLLMVQICIIDTLIWNIFWVPSEECQNLHQKAWIQMEKFTPSCVQWHCNHPSLSLLWSASSGTGTTLLSHSPESCLQTPLSPTAMKWVQWHCNRPSLPIPWNRSSGTAITTPPLLWKVYNGTITPPFPLPW